MQFGICASVDRSAELAAAGADFVEENVQKLLDGLIADSDWTGDQRAATSKLPIPAANSLVPGDLKIVGPDVDPEELHWYMEAVLKRAKTVGMKVLVFGSGGARNVPEGFGRGTAHQQIVEFLKMSAPIAEQNGITLVAEPLNRKECNIINTVAEAMTFVRDVDHPAFQCLVDSYHFWLDDNNLDDLKAAMPWIRHVHLADKDGRVPPGESGTADYRPFFRVIKEGNYQGLISVEALGFKDYKNVAPRVLAFIKKQWQEA